ncbi:MAG: hypothetical protein N4A35_05465 [Flavobacteriales bacterium]|jgi:hypothetical protein|nr:hypothetical protein [Flavobacteriales bacterium]
MARLITEIYDSIITEKQQMSELSNLQPQIDNSQTLLNDLTTTSKVANWRLFIWLFAVAAWVHENIFDRHKAEIEERVKAAVTGNIRWYRQECLKFQFGDTLAFVDHKYQYPSINTTNQIIQRAAVSEVGSQLRIKVAKIDGSGTPEPLTGIELVAFNNYINKIKFAGTNIAVISSDADEIEIHYTITVNQQVISGSGESLIAPGTYPVIDVIKNYIQNLPFDGVLNFTKLTDEIQKIEGVIDPVFNTALARYGVLPFQIVQNNYYRPNAGHLKASVTNPLSTTITYK